MIINMLRVKGKCFNFFLWYIGVIFDWNDGYVEIGFCYVMNKILC